MRRALMCILLALCLAAPVAAMGDDEAAFEVNSISLLVRSQPPVLQAGYLSDGDKWLLFSPQFDVLSSASQRFLLEKYGYASPALVSPFAKSGTVTRRAVAPPAFQTVAPGANINVISTEIGRRLQSEATIAVSGNRVVVGYNSTGDFVSYSHDGGATWRHSRLTPFPNFTGTSGDPVLAAGPNGRFYHAYMAPSVFGMTSMAVAYSDDGGVTWSRAVNASASAMGASSSHDKPWFAVDNVAGSPYRGNLYLTWTRFQSNGSSISFVRSTDGGRTWTQEVPLAALTAVETNRREVIQGSYIATGPAGEVYVVWYDSRVSGIRLRRSTDGGATFGPPATALAPLGFSFSKYVNGHFDVPAFPQVAVDTSSGPNRGAVYVVSNVAYASGDMEVVLARSTDGGNTWNTPVRVNNDITRTDQFMPAVAVADNGAIGVMFYDRRNDPERNLLTDVYLAVSTDGGLTFPLNQRVTTTNWAVLPTPLGYRTGYHSDYNQLVASGSHFLLAWGDDRGSDPDVYFASMPIAGGIPDLVLGSVESFASVVAGGTARYTITVDNHPDVALSAVSSAPGITVQMAANVLTAATTVATPPGTYSIRVRGTRQGVERSTTVRLNVHAPELRQAPIAITHPREEAYQAQAVVDSAGNIHVVASRENSSRARRRLSYLRVPAGSSGFADIRDVVLSDLALREQTVVEPRITIDPNGRALVVWRRSDRNGEHLLFSRMLPDGSFTAPIDLSTISFQSAIALAPAMAYSPDGSIFIAYIQASIRQLSATSFSVTASEVFITRLPNGGAAFLPPVNVTRFTGSPRFADFNGTVSLSVDGRGNPHVAFVTLDVSQNQIQNVYYATSNDGGLTFGPSLNVTTVNTTAITPREPSLAVDANGVAYVAFTNPDTLTGQRDILLARIAQGRAQIVGNVSQAAAYWSGDLVDLPAVIIDHNGTITAAWRQLTQNSLKQYDGQRDIFFARSSDGGSTWTPAVNLSSSVGDTLRPPAVTLGTGGRVHILWDDDSAGSAQILMATLP